LKAVLLDLGDTLVCMNRSWDELFSDNLRALYEYLIKLDIQLDRQKFTRTFIRTYNDASYSADLYRIEIPMEAIISKALKKFGVRPTDDMILKGTAEFFGPEVESWQLFPDTMDVLSRLEREGYMMGLISNTKSDWAVHAILQRRGLEGFFKTIVTSAAVKVRKPRPEIFLRALEDLSIPASEAIFVGDSIQSDVSGAKHMGIRSIHVARKPVEAEGFNQPDATVKSLTEAFEIITQWRNMPMKR